MSDTSFMPVRSLHQPPIVFVLFDARVAPDQLPNLADVLRDQFSEGNHPLQVSLYFLLLSTQADLHRKHR
jgi:hypothetical protein